MANDIQVNMRFNADVTQAKAAMQELQNSLQKVAQAPIGKNALFDDQEFQKASEAATELAAKLQAAFNVNTGKLDLLKFTADLKSSNKDLQYFKTNLLNAGDVGHQAFLNLSNAIATAEMPLIRVNSKIKEFGTTMMNTVKWGVSSSIMNSFSGAVQKAYGYAQDLNKSLTDIRIVTGQSSDQMAEFAKRANETAKALSATTLDYTEGALVYYQQGNVKIL